ncbi:hypothetical protein DM01DRAFT_1041198 [Hesseltinella vesiculosa]|uniref:Uncharacterized protein n=1 Tax=Hesseltinella vesiculosa TaxID=101127 RepID=A0A1X2GHJ5_9FUNG|nr:hypothetical protein DM01DRAFT_1041198 [Hesseltinella vesiculosa]
MHVKRKTIPIQQTVSDIKHRLPPSLQHPFLTALRAYGLTWMLTTLPGLVGALIKMAIKSSKRRSFAPLRQFIFQTVPRIFHASVVHNGLPWLMTGAIASTPFFTYALERLASRSRQEKKDKRFSRWLSHHPMLARTMSIGLSMWLVRRVFPKTKTLEWTFFALVRASDITASRAADNPIVRRYLPKWLFDYGSVVVFTLACTEIMFAWFYAPHRLPR